MTAQTEQIPSIPAQDERANHENHPIVALLPEAQAGDPAALEALCGEIMPRVFGYLYAAVKDIHAAEDLTQDAMIKILRNLPNFELQHEAGFSGWTRVIALNLVRDKARRDKHANAAFSPLDENRDHPRLYDTTTDSSMERAENQENLQFQLAKIDPTFRQVVELVDVYGYSYEEVAIRLGMKLGTIRSRLHRGRKQLRDRLAEEGRVRF